MIVLTAAGIERNVCQESSAGGASSASTLVDW